MAWAYAAFSTRSLSVEYIAERRTRHAPFAGVRAPLRAGPHCASSVLRPGRRAVQPGTRLGSKRLITHTGDALVVPALNRDGDCLSDMVLQLFGSIAGAESLLLAFDDDLRATTIMAEAPHGTAPTLEGKSIANPLAMILAGAALLGFMHDPGAAVVSRGIYEAALEAVADGVRTADLGGHYATEEFTDEVIKRVRTKLDVWSTLGESAVI